MASLAGRVISITGAASGMGMAFARLAASNGAKLALADIQKGPLKDLEADFRSKGVEAKATVLDVRSSQDVDSWIGDTVKHFGRLDSAANVAGILPPNENFVDTTNELWDKILGVNLYGVMHCVRAQLRVMEKGATIVNFASTAGTHAQAGQTVYSISKHGVVALTKNVAREIAGKDIRINAVAPGPIFTPLVKAAGAVSADDSLAPYVPLGRWGRPEEVAHLVAFLLGKESSYMHGHITYIDGGFVS